MGSKPNQTDCFHSQGIDEMKTKNHSLILLIAKSVSFLLALLVVTSIIHEGAHWLLR